MSDAPTTAAAASSYPTVRLASGRLAILIIKSVGSAVIAALMGVNWADMSTQQKFMAIVAITVNAATAIEAFFDKTMSRLAEGQAIRKAGSTGTSPPMTVS